MIGEINYALEPYKDDYKNTPSRDWLDSSSVFREKEASLLLSQREERIDNHFTGQEEAKKEGWWQFWK